MAPLTSKGDSSQRIDIERQKSRKTASIMVEQKTNELIKNLSNDVMNARASPYGHAKFKIYEAAK